MVKDRFLIASHGRVVNIVYRIDKTSVNGFAMKMCRALYAFYDRRFRMWRTCFTPEVKYPAAELRSI